MPRAGKSDAGGQVPCGINLTNLRDTSQWDVVSDELVSNVTELSNFLGAECVNPSLGVVLVVLGLPEGRAGDLLGEICVRPQLVIDGGMLPGCLDAIGEDLPIDHLLDWGRELRRSSGWVFHNRWSHDEM